MTRHLDRFPELNPKLATTKRLAQCSRLVRREDFARPIKGNPTFGDFLQSLPATLAGADLRYLARSIATSHCEGNIFLLMMGAHPIKTGLNPLICDLLRREIVNAVALNGACIIHDFELAYAGRTSENVGAGLADGTFGMAEETGAFLNNAVRRAAQEDLGLGEVIGREIQREELQYRDSSILATAYEMGTPVTVHVAIGADIIHMHPNADGAAIGKATLTDFHRLAAVIGNLSGGVALNLGSAVILPEVFMKALNLARNLGCRISDFTTADMDFTRHYRPRNNVVERPTVNGGRGIMLTGHHEIMFPLLAAAISEELQRHP
jgi:deoxyhypusine synthase